MSKAIYNQCLAMVNKPNPILKMLRRLARCRYEVRLEVFDKKTEIKAFVWTEHYKTRRAVRAKLISMRFKDPYIAKK